MPVRTPISRSPRAGARGARTSRARATPRSVEQLQRALVARSRPARARARRSRARPAHRPRARRPGTRAPGRSRRPACAARRSRPRSRCPSRRSRRARARSSAADRRPGRGRVAPHIFTRSGWARMSKSPLRAASRERLEVARPDLLRAAPGLPDVEAIPVDREVAEEVDRADRRSRGRSARSGSAVRSSRPGHEVDLETEPQVGLARARSRSTRRCRRSPARARTGGPRSRGTARSDGCARRPRARRSRRRRPPRGSARRWRR